MVLGQLRDRIRPDRSGPAVVVRGVTETYRLYTERPTGLKERLYRLRRARYTDFHALEDVTFSVERGESVGIIGHNGSGKSTLLKLLARILPPDVGQVEINGTVASLLELGAGFHGELSGRENIYLNGAILGLSRAEIEERFDEIVDFAGVREFIDQPVRNFSSGMYVRLGFAIAVHVDPDILLVDEVLSVGDVQFQTKSLERMRSFQERGKTVVLVSHDLAAIADLCDRVLILDHGRLVFDGPAREGIELYVQLMGTAGPGSIGEASPPSERSGSGAVRVVRAEVLGEDGQPVERVLPSSRLVLRVRIQAAEAVATCSVGATFETGDGRHVFEVHTTWQGIGVGPLTPGQDATVEIRFTANVLAGQYAITPAVTDATGRLLYDVVPHSTGFEVQPVPGGAGLVDFAATTAVVDGPSVRLDVVTPDAVRRGLVDRSS